MTDQAEMPGCFKCGRPFVPVDVWVIAHPFRSPCGNINFYVCSDCLFGANEQGRVIYKGLAQVGIPPR
jgi:hypothetical protein